MDAIVPPLERSSDSSNLLQGCFCFASAGLQPVYWLARTVITKDHKLSGLNNKFIISQF